MSVGDNSLAKDILENAVKEIERLTETRREINEQISNILTEAESRGLDKKTVREVIKMRSLGDEFTDRENLRDLYLKAIGLL